jgi:hypothetical protein
MKAEPLIELGALKNDEGRSMEARLAATEAALLSDLASTFPAANPASLREWLGQPSRYGVVVSGEAEIEPDFPIGPYRAVDDDAYEGGLIHLAFVAWAELRGWHVEVYEPGTLWLVPLAEVDGVVEAWQRAWAENPSEPLKPGECPF